MNWDILKPIIAGQLRHYLTIAAGSLVTYGLMKSDQSGAFVEIASGLIVGAVGVAWSWWQKVGHAKLQAHLQKMTGTATPQAAAAVAAASPATPPPQVAALAAKVAGMLLALIVVSSFMSIDRAQAQGLAAQLPGLKNGPIHQLVGAVDQQKAAGVASGNDIKLTGDPLVDLHAAIQKGGDKLVLHLKQSYALAMATTASGAADNTSANCTRALVPIAELVIRGPKAGTLKADDPMGLTPAEVTMAADPGELEGIIVKVEKLRILRLALNSPALNDACGALVTDEVKNAQGLVGKITSLITGVGLLPLGM